MSKTLDKFENNSHTNYIRMYRYAQSSIRYLL